MRVSGLGIAWIALVGCGKTSTPQDEGCDAPAPYYADADGDGFGDGASAPTDVCPGDDVPGGLVDDASDCDDTDDFVHPGIPERCDGVDEDCDGVVDNDPTDGSAWYPDRDADGFGDGAAFTVACDAPSGYVASASDCDDGDPDVYPFADEVCDDVDNDCNGVVDDPDLLPSELYYPDADGDGFGDAEAVIDSCAPVPDTVGNGLDSDDTAATIHPGADETCEDGVDQDCDGADAPCVTHWTEPFVWTATRGQWCGSDALAYYAYFGETTFEECQTMANLTGTQWYVGEDTDRRYGWIGAQDATTAAVTSGTWTAENIVSRTDLYSCQLAVFDHRTEPTEAPAEQLYTDDEGRLWHFWELTSQTHSQAVAFADDRGARVINPNSIGKTGTLAFTAPTHWCHAGAQFNGAGNLNSDSRGNFVIGFWQ